MERLSLQLWEAWYDLTTRVSVAFKLFNVVDLIQGLDTPNWSPYTTATIFILTLLLSRYLLFRPLASPAVPGLPWADPRVLGDWQTGPEASPFLVDSNHQDTQGQGQGQHKPPVLLVIAHPDDECMFFGPTLLALHAQSIPVHILCLSTGNADGLGLQRVPELVRSAKVLHIPADRVHYVDSPDLQDGMRNEWPAREILRHVRDTVARFGVAHLVTFDHLGVSGHPNHTAIARAVQIDPDLAPRTWHLHSVPRLAKYALAFVRADTLRDATAPDPTQWWSLGETGARLGGPRRDHLDVWRVVARPAQVQRAQQAMRQHASQLVWYRRLFVRFARYFVVNELVKMGTTQNSSRGKARVVTASNTAGSSAAGTAVRSRQDKGNRTV